MTAPPRARRDCLACRMVKPLSDFPVDRSRRSGVYPYCRACKSAKQRARYVASPKPQPGTPFVNGIGLGLFDSKLRVEAVVADRDPCWVWQAVRLPNGYGRFTIGSRKYVAHRYAYETLIGPIPAGLQLDHLCRNRPCVNPAHLEPVTPRENTLRGLTIPAAHAAKTHCPQGHEYTPENIYSPPSRPRVRDCATCKKNRDRSRDRRRIA